MAARRRPPATPEPLSDIERLEAGESLNQDADTAFMQALLAGATVRQAAQIAGISEATAHRRKADKAFVRRYREQQAAMQQRSLQLLTAGGPTGINALVRLSQGGYERVEHPETREVVWVLIPKTAQIQAATKLVELAVGSLARVQVSIDADTDRSEVEDRTRARLDSYKDEALKLLESAIEVSGREGTPVEPRALTTESAKGSADSGVETARSTTESAKPQVARRRRA